MSAADLSNDIADTADTAAAPFDVAIVGGGLVGCSLAVALCAQQRRVALIEAFAPRDGRPAWDERCIALNAASRQILEALGLWERLAPEAEPITATHISERGRFGAARFGAADADLPALGYNTPLRAINAALWDAVRASGVAVYCPVRLGDLQTLGDRVFLRLDGGEQPQRIQARLLVAADGAQSAVRHMLGLDAEVREYGQSAIVTAIRPRYPHAGVAYERFIDTGPLAVLPKPDDADGHACSLVWTVPSESAEALCALDEAAFIARTQELFGERLGAFRALGRRQHYPLARVMSRQLHAPRTVFIGNAAQSLHPVAAQGFNLGLRDAATLAELLDTAADPGDGALLAAYAQRREQDRQRVAGFTDRLVRLFSNTVPGLRGLRHLGLMFLDIDSPARQAILRQNLGYGAPLPRPARA